MVDNQSSRVSRNIASSTQLQEAGGVPRQLGLITPTIDVSSHPNTTIEKSFFGTRTTTGTGTLVTLDTDKDFYLTNLSYFLQCNVTADSTDYSVRAVIDGESQRLIQIQKLSLTATTITIEKTFPFPIKVDRATAITFPQAFTVGASSVSVTVQGFFR